MIIKEENEILYVIFDDNNIISEVRYDMDGVCSVFSKENTMISQFETICTAAYNHQYGTPVSPDGKYLYIGSWERGLYCYDIQSGGLLWRRGPGKVRAIFLCEGYLIIEMCGRGVYKRDSKTGELLDEIKMSTIDDMYRISDIEIFTGVYRNKYYIHEIPSLKKKLAIESSILNINRCLSFCLLDVKREKDSLLIKGWEKYPDGDNSKDDISYFNRSVFIGI